MNSSNSVAGGASVLNGATGANSVLSGISLSAINQPLAAALDNQAAAVQNLQDSLSQLSNNLNTNQTQVSDIMSIAFKNSDNTGFAYKKLQSIQNAPVTTQNPQSKKDSDTGVWSTYTYASGERLLSDMKVLLDKNQYILPPEQRGTPETIRDNNIFQSRTGLVQNAQALTAAIAESTSKNTSSLMDRIDAFRNAANAVQRQQNIDAINNPTFIAAANAQTQALAALNAAAQNVDNAIKANQANVQVINNAISNKAGSNIGTAGVTAWEDPITAKNTVPASNAMYSILRDGIKTDTNGNTQNSLDYKLGSDKVSVDKVTDPNKIFNSSTAKVTTPGLEASIDAVNKAINQGDPANGVKSLKQAVADVAKTTQNLATIRTVIAAATASSNASLAAATKDAAAKRNNAVTILPTAKAGIVAFFGKHQSVSVEYQYYFRNTNPNFTSGEVTLNYAYYFGGK
ncbi:hypothetical protein [Helicobacter sp. 11S02629-2]|uniref:hypothetical protein n=1 Tax=Helicobacter sp. 11S02629-2 TaxID=1476195 RepID=UPI000BA583DF|nr:hypothetical protein [Helicobacter sp. 11S02629-2]PAF41213.1 hypothetical protein BKH40_08495 [Helicobacter sp. 11S02629-2]